MVDPTSPAQEIAVLGGGCFWCLEAALSQLQGVASVVSGYSGGALDHPDYRSVCSGHSGHAEVVRIAFDPAVIDYRTLLLAFFAIHDPTTLNRQGDDVGSQYRSVIQFQNSEQETIARRLIAELEASGTWQAPVVTELVPAAPFWPAEEYHQRYFSRNPEQPYCQYVVGPKTRKLRELFRDRLKA
ncbi:peptide-methionine (S)-S-oxide reductase MsrA [Denitratisoma sp. agr-D3]